MSIKREELIVSMLDYLGTGCGYDCEYVVCRWLLTYLIDMILSREELGTT